MKEYSKKILICDRTGERAPAIVNAVMVIRLLTFRNISLL